MFEYHVWITLRSTAEAVDDEPLLGLEEIQDLVYELAGHGLTDLRQINGGYYVHLGGFPNHRGTQGSQVIDLGRPPDERHRDSGHRYGGDRNRRGASA